MEHFCKKRQYNPSGNSHTSESANLVNKHVDYNHLRRLKKISNFSVYVVIPTRVWLPGDKNVVVLAYIEGPNFLLA